MSRIHEALRKAELAGQIAGDPVLDVLSEGVPATPEPTPANQFPTEEAERILTGAMPEGGVAVSSAQLPQFRRCNWTPNAERTLFIAESGTRQSAAQEQFRTLRSRLLRVRAQQPLKTILVTSSLPGEGKTFVSANLAFVLARQHGRRVLLVDADLRRPSLHNLLGAPANPGLTDCLAGRSDEQSAIQGAPTENLFFMPGGTPASNPSELIVTGTFAKLMHSVQALFDWVIIDTPPVIPVSDAAVMSETCDGVVLVLKAGSTPFDIAQRARDEFHHAPVVGVVLNRTGASHSYGLYHYELYGNEPAQKAGKG